MKFFWQPDNDNDYDGSEEQKVDSDPKNDSSGIKDDSDDNDDDSDDSDNEWNEDEWEGHAIRHLMWDDSSPFSSLAQSYGSVWPRVLPFCICNVIWTCVVFYLKDANVINLTMHSSGHKYTAPLMSFLLVTRLKIIFDNYMSQSRYLQGLYKSCRELVAHLCVLTANYTNRRAKRWRQDVTYSVLILLRVAIGVLEFRSTNQDPWLLPEMALENSEEVVKYAFKEDHHDNKQVQKMRQDLERMRSYNSMTETHAEYNVQEQDQEDLQMPSLKKRLAHMDASDRTPLEEASRAVFVMAWNVRHEILKQRDGTWLQSRSLVGESPNVMEEMKLLDCVEDFLKSFVGSYKLLTTPMPMPLVQMNKIFLYVWLSTLPMTLAWSTNNNTGKEEEQRGHLLFTIILVFVLTFGFLGLEFVSIEMADPFGHDPSDFDDLGHAQMAMEDCYITIYRLDGKHWAKALRKRFKTKENVDATTPQNSSTPWTVTRSSTM